MPKPNTAIFQHVCPRPETPRGFDFVGATVSAGGEGLFLFIGDDIARDVHATESSGIGIFPKPRMPNAKPFKLLIEQEGRSSVITIPPIDLSFPHVELFPDGRVLLASARCAWRSPTNFDENGIIFDPKTGALTRFLLGDGIADLAIDEVGRIWVSYFDEGVFGNFGWSGPGPSGAGAGGLVCFNDRGEILWRFNREDGPAFIDDCYALNATRTEVWVYFYSAFHLCRVDSDFSQTLLASSGIAGSSAFAVSDAAFLFTSQYDEPGDTLHMLPRTGAKLGKPQTLRAGLPGAASMKSARVVGRGGSLHVLDAAGWFKLDIANVVGGTSS